jgi:hypothetical protein
MNNYLIIYIILIIICILIFIAFQYKNTKKENFKEPDVPRFVQDFENIVYNNNPNYKYQNITQYNFERLFKKLEKINKKKINLKDKSNYNFYTQSTTDDKLRMDLDIITKYVLLVINNDKYYNFAKTNYGDVKVWVDKKGNEEITYELFLWDMKNYFEIKLLVNIIKFVEENQSEIYGIRKSPYITPFYNIGYPFKDQIIPLPTETIITGHFDTGTSTIRPNEPEPIKYLYLNQITVQNSTLIVDYEKDKYPFPRLEVSENGFSGVTDMSLEYIKIKGDNNPYFEKGKYYNQWPTLDSEPKWVGQYPSKPPPQDWDVDGVYYYGEKDAKPFSDKRLCDAYEPGTRWSPDKEPLQPDFWPTLATIPRNCGENEWLFDLSRSVNGNTFIGGGKR